VHVDEGEFLEQLVVVLVFYDTEQIAFNCFFSVTDSIFYDIYEIVLVAQPIEVQKGIL
tara:strand:- start:1341 stop:1514 length:174 start_codon:yes stop_codon:yes gene_type:complete